MEVVGGDTETRVLEMGLQTGWRVSLCWILECFTGDGGENLRARRNRMIESFNRSCLLLGFMVDYPSVVVPAFSSFIFLCLF